MKSNLSEKLKFKLNPVAILFTDVKPENAFQAKPGVRVCAASLLVAAAAKDTISVFDEETYGCAGGGVGLCFGNAYEKMGLPADALLSRGDEVLQARNQEYFRSLGMGERFFASGAIAQKWLDSIPYTQNAAKYVVFKPLHLVEDNETPALVLFFANPDQLSALITLAGYFRGTSFNVAAPFASACQQILLACQEIGKPEPLGIMGFFDISQRCAISSDLLTLTVPFAMYEELERGTIDSFFETPEWKKLDERLCKKIKTAER